MHRKERWDQSPHANEDSPPLPPLPPVQYFSWGTLKVVEKTSCYFQLNKPWGFGKSKPGGFFPSFEVVINYSRTFFANDNIHIRNCSQAEDLFASARASCSNNRLH